MVELRLYAATTAVRFCHDPPNIRSVAQPGSATALGAVGRGFDSLHSDQST